jgi:uncharacterized protein DUF262/uncharacterized protein DUF1524
VPGHATDRPAAGAPLYPPLAARSVKLGQLFADPVLIETPTYQRAFAWGAEEAGRLLEDIVSAHEAGLESGEGGDYFLGTMLLIDRDATARHREGWPLAGDPRTFEVVDGLQRLTTLTILFCVLRDLAADEGEPPGDRLLDAIETKGKRARARLTLRQADAPFFLAHVCAPGASHAMPAGEELTPSEARILEVREHLVTGLLDLEPQHRRRLLEFLLERCFVVFAVTTSIDRAHRMFMVLNDTGKPLARNDILKAELLGGVPTGAAPAATAAWDGMEKSLGRDFESLFSHIRAMYGRPGGHVIAGIRTIAAEAGGAQPFIEGVLRPAAAIFDDIRLARHAGSPHSAAIARTLRYLSWLPAADWVPSAMLWWLTHGKDPASLAWFLAALDRLAYGLRIVGLGASRRLNRFGALNWAIRNDQDLKGASSPLTFTREELRNLTYNLRDLHERSAPTCKLVLLRLNDQIMGRPQSLESDSLTVEHVLPRKHGQNSQWRAWFPNPDERNRCTESLGNLVLVTKAQNDKASNLDFTKKRDVYFRTAGAPVPALNESVRRQSEWKAPQIKAREADLLRHLDALWNFGAAASRKDATGGAEAPPARGRRRTAVA